MLPISPDWMTQTATLWMLISVRLLGCFMTMPLFAFRSAPMRLRVLLALVIAFALVYTLSLHDALPISEERRVGKE